MLGRELVVADLERQVAGVRPEVIQLLERRIARGARQVQGNDDVVVRGLRLQQQSDGRGPFIEGALAPVLFRIEVRVIEAAAELQRGMGRFELFVDEPGHARGAPPAASALLHRRP